MNLPAYLAYQFFNIIMLIMLIRVLMSWIPNISWHKEPYYSLRKFTDYIFMPFKFIPPIGMFDISPIFAFITIGFIQNVCVKLLSLI